MVPPSLTYTGTERKKLTKAERYHLFIFISRQSFLKKHFLSVRISRVKYLPDLPTITERLCMCMALIRPNNVNYIHEPSTYQRKSQIYLIQFIGKVLLSILAKCTFCLQFMITVSRDNLVF